MPMLASGVAMITSQQPRRAAFPAKQRPETMPTSGTRPLSPPKRAKASVSRPVTDRRVGVARSTATTFGEQDDGEPQPFDQREEPVLLAVVHLALGAGQHRVVVGEHGGAGLRVVEAVAVDAADPGDQAVGRRVGDEVVERRAGARWAATTSAPYSSKLPGSHRSAMFSRAVLRPPA